MTHLLLTALVAGALYTGKPATLGARRGVVPVVVVVVMIYEADRTAVHCASLALRASAIRAMAPNVDRQLGAFHWRPKIRVGAREEG
jgi:hypothetical protein